MVPVTQLALALLLLAGLARPAVGRVQWNPNMRSFGVALKLGSLKANVEQVVFEHNGTGSVLQQWHGGPYVHVPTNISVYVDGEAVPSLQYDMLMAHAVGVNQDSPPGPPHTWTQAGWDSELFAHSANDGVYNTFQIPFGSSVRITLTAAADTVFYYMARGVENYPITLGNLELPATARLRLAKTSAAIEKTSWTTYAAVSGTAGAILASSWRVESASTKYQEGCVRAFIDGSPDALWLSSGLEDYFLVAYFHQPGTEMHGRLNGFQRNASTTGGDFNSIQAYRIHTADPLLFTSSISLEWQAPIGNGGQADCPHSWPPPPTARRRSPRGRSPPAPAGPDGAGSPVLLTTYTWYYAVGE